MKNLINRYLPHPLLSFGKNLLNKIRKRELQKQINKQYNRHKLNLERIKDNEKLTVAFFAIHSSVWKYDYLYKLMENHPKFEPVIIVCPAVNYGIENMLLEMNKCYEMFNTRNYNVIKAYNDNTHEYLDIKKEINPDVIFYTNPYKGLIDDRYYVTKFPDVLTCYVSYNYGNSCLYDMFHNLPFHNLVWRFYAETEEHKNYSVKYSDNKGQNVIVTGYPGIDAFLDPTYEVKDVWKIKDPKYKRIIWAPHHSIGENEVVTYSSFLQYADYMIDIAKKYVNEIQIAFKPHPLLRAKLNLYWGVDKTTRYYDMWNGIPNGFLAEDDYIDLFLSSDAMIHDCGSFITEYLYTKKPVLRTDNRSNDLSQFNPFAIDCLSVYYHAISESDIEEFINNIINEKDDMKDKRVKFYYEKLILPNNKLASSNILDDLLCNIN